MQGTFVNLCYTMENHAIATMMTYFGSTDHGLGTEVDRGRGGHRVAKIGESRHWYIYIYIYYRERERERESWLGDYAEIDKEKKDRIIIQSKILEVENPRKDFFYS